MSTVKYAIITDLHANLPALRSALNAIETKGYDFLVHTGDLISIGPFPRECFELLSSKPRVIFTKGNHEDDLCAGLPDVTPAAWSESELAHYRWTDQQLHPSMKDAMCRWPHVYRARVNGVSISFQHYALTPDENLLDLTRCFRKPIPSDLAMLFDRQSDDLIFYGHDHHFGDHRIGLKRCINPGSLGCFNQPIARYSIATIFKDKFEIEQHQVCYDDVELRNAFMDRRVPDRELIQKIFFGDRWLLS